MASSFHTILICSFVLIPVSLAAAKTSFKPKSLILPVTKDASTNQYITRFSQRTLLVPLSLTLDLGGQFLWVDCDHNYVSSTYRPIHCKTAQCSLARSTACGDCFSPPRPGCNNNTCSLIPDNTITRTATSGELASDVVSLQSTNGKNPGKFVSLPKFLFVCGSQVILDGLASGVTGMAGLGRTNISLPSQFSTSLNFPRKFAVCLSSSTRSTGVVIFGDGPYVFLPNIDVSTNLLYTPLIINPVSTASAFSSGEPSAEYFIRVKSIKINDKVVKINTTLLKIDKEGNGGTKITSFNRYTVLETSIFKAVVRAFTRALKKVPRVVPVVPFGVCYNSTFFGSTRVGPALPQIDLVLQNSKVFWRIFGANSMVQVSDDVSCLGFFDGGENPRTSIVIGAHQLEDNLLQFDLESSRLGFSSSLLFRQTTCANFNFTSNA